MVIERINAVNQMLLIVQSQCILLLNRKLWLLILIVLLRTLQHYSEVLNMCCDRRCVYEEKHPVHSVNKAAVILPITRCCKYGCKLEFLEVHEAKCSTPRYNEGTSAFMASLILIGDSIVKTWLTSCLRDLQ